jgi:hypothetical protein
MPMKGLSITKIDLIIALAGADLIGWFARWCGG